MACNNSSAKNNQPNKSEKTLLNVHFNNVSEKSLEENWQYKNTKYKYSIFAQEQKYDNVAVWQIDSLKRLLAKMDKDPKRVLSIILDMQSIYTKYLNKANKADKNVMRYILAR